MCLLFLPSPNEDFSEGPKADKTLGGVSEKSFFLSGRVNHGWMVADVAPLIEPLARRRYSGRSSPRIALTAIFQMLEAAFVSRFHSLEQVLHLTSPCLRTLPVRNGRGFSHTLNVLHSPPQALQRQLVRNSSTRFTP